MNILKTLMSWIHKSGMIVIKNTQSHRKVHSDKEEIQNTIVHWHECFSDGDLHH